MTWARPVLNVRASTWAAMLLLQLLSVLVPVPAACQGLPPTRTITVQWSAPLGSVVDGYLVFIGTRGRQYIVMKQTGKSARKTAVVTVSDIETCYTVAAFNLVAGAGPWGDEVCVPPAP